MTPELLFVILGFCLTIFTQTICGVWFISSKFADQKESLTNIINKHRLTAVEEMGKLSNETRTLISDVKEIIWPLKNDILRESDHRYVLRSECRCANDRMSAGH